MRSQPETRDIEAPGTPATFGPSGTVRVQDGPDHAEIRLPRKCPQDLVSGRPNLRETREKGGASAQRVRGPDPQGYATGQGMPRASTRAAMASNSSRGIFSSVGQGVSRSSE